MLQLVQMGSILKCIRQPLQCGLLDVEQILEIFGLGSNQVLDSLNGLYIELHILPYLTLFENLGSVFFFLVLLERADLDLHLKLFGLLVLGVETPDDLHFAIVHDP